MPRLPGTARRTAERGAAGLRLVPGVGGVDEAGRGPLAGPVVAAVVVLGPEQRIDGVADSKCLPAEERERLAGVIEREAIASAVASATVREIDRHNILHATMLAMQRAVRALGCHPELLRVDGNRAPTLRGFRGRLETLVGGDGLCVAVGAASILAKVHRDRYMCELDRRYPQFGFARHKGYATPEHLDCLARLRPCPEHRRSFAPVALAWSVFEGRNR